MNILAHANQAVICGNHQQAVIRFAAKHTKYGSAEVALMSCEICKRDYFCLYGVSLNGLQVSGSALTDRLPISSQESFRPWTLAATTSPRVSKPIISMPTELVRPLSTSCLCINTRLRVAVPAPWAWKLWALTLVAKLWLLMSKVESSLGRRSAGDL